MLYLPVVLSTRLHPPHAHLVLFPPWTHVPVPQQTKSQVPLSWTFSCFWFLGVHHESDSLTCVFCLCLKKFQSSFIKQQTRTHIVLKLTCALGLHEGQGSRVLQSLLCALVLAHPMTPYSLNLCVSFASSLLSLVLVLPWSGWVVFRGRKHQSQEKRKGRQV